MKVNVETKFDIGDKAYRTYLGGYSEIEILGIEIHLSKNNSAEIFYTYKPYSDSASIHEVRQESLYTKREAERLRAGLPL